MPEPLRPASGVYAKVMGQECKGEQQCHYCAGPCGRGVLHDDAPVVPFVKSKSGALRPNEPWICEACDLWRRQRVTVNHLSGGFKDRQRVRSLSWLVTPQGAWAVTEQCGEDLFDTLLTPPEVFFLSLLDPAAGAVDNHLHLCVVHEHKDGVKADAEIPFTLNNRVCTYSVYELEEGLAYGDEGRMPGVRTLIRLFGRPAKYHKKPSVPPDTKDPDKPKGGRPTYEQMQARKADPREGQQSRVVKEPGKA